MRRSFVCVLRQFRNIIQQHPVLLRNGDVPRVMPRRRWRHRFDSCTLRSYAHQSMREARLRSRGLHDWRHRSGRSALLRTQGVWNPYSRSGIRQVESVSGRLEAVLGGRLRVYQRYAGYDDNAWSYEKITYMLTSRCMPRRHSFTGLYTHSRRQPPTAARRCLRELIGTPR